MRILSLNHKLQFVGDRAYVSGNQIVFPSPAHIENDAEEICVIKPATLNVEGDGKLYINFVPNGEGKLHWSDKPEKDFLEIGKVHDAQPADARSTNNSGLENRGALDSGSSRKDNEARKETK